MNKYDFMQQLSQREDLSPAQKERFFLLAHNEMKNDVELFTNLEDRVKKLEEGKIILKNKSQEFLSTGLEINNTKKKAEPRHVADFMSLFNQREGLKYLTHDYDENGDFDIDEFLRQSYEVFESNTKKLKIPISLWTIVKKFAFDSNQTEWSSISKDYRIPIKIKQGWASKELRDWSKENNSHPISNQNYERMITNFKRILRIEKNNFELILDAALNDDYNDFTINKKDLDKADFYTHVQFLIDALKVIFSEIKERSKFIKVKEITISYERTYLEDYYVRELCIFHHHSLPTKELSLLSIEWKEKGNMGKIFRKLEGFAHWSIETDIEDKPTRVNLLKDSEKNDYEFLESPVGGFRHILTFYYKG